MKSFPWVSRRAHDEAVAQLKAESASWEAWYHATEQHLANMMRHYESVLDKYHALRVQGASVAPPVPPVEPVESDTPPDVVLQAMRTISPVKDKTYEANWAYWEQHKERAAQHPEAFAEEILYGTAQWQPLTRTLSTMALPDEPSVNGRMP